MNGIAGDSTEACRKAAVVVPILGMQQSGTATLGRLLVNLGAQLAQANSACEPDVFQQVNSQLLKITGCDTSGFDAPKKLFTAARLSGQITVEEFRKCEIANFIEHAFSSACWGWSDPRTILTLDFWLRILQELGFDQVRPIIVVHHPDQVIQRMVAGVDAGGKDQFSVSHLHRLAGDLWMTYHRLLWRFCCRFRWAVVTFEALNDQNTAIQERHRIADYCGLNGCLASSSASGQKVVETPPPELCLGEILPIPIETRELYEQFQRLATPSRVHLTESAMDRDELRLVRKAQLLKDAGRIDAAVELLGKALKFRPQYRSARFLLSYTLMETGHIDRSFEHSNWLIETQPDDAVGHGLRAFGLTQQARIDEAIIEFRACLRYRPDNSVAWSNLLFSSLYSDSLSPTEVAALHVEGAAAIAKVELAKQPSEALAPMVVADDRTVRPLRIGYLSADLKKHPVGYFVRWLLEHHDSERFAVNCYHTGQAQDDLTTKLRNSCRNWHEVHDLDVWQLTNKIRSDKIDLLVDLSGHSSGNRCGTLIRRAAPVQAMYLGYPATSGLAEMDFLIADEYLCPPECDHLYTERVAKLKHCFLCFHPHEDAPPVAEAPCERNGFVTFGSFNNLPKISHSTIVLWSQLLKRVPRSRLVIKALSLVDAGTRRLFHQHFMEQGIETTRIDLLPPSIPLSNFLNEYRRIDIGLDPIPYNGGTTTCEALWMGVPVITLPGEAFCGRMGLSILSTLGHPEWIAQSKENYINLAAQLAAQPQLIAEHRRSLRDQMLSSPLCDGKLFTIGFENCCRWMIDQVAPEAV